MADWFFQIEELDASILTDRMTIKRPEVEFPGQINESYRDESELESIPSRDYEVKNGMTDIDIMMEAEFNELEVDYPRNGEARSKI